MITRVNSSSLQDTDWAALVRAFKAIDGTHQAPNFDDFVQLHQRAMDSAEGMSWDVHRMPGMGMAGHNFLPWHRVFLVSFEARLRQLEPNVVLPYWDWRTTRELPAALTDEAFLRGLGVTRSWDPRRLPAPAQIDAVLQVDHFPAFQLALESVHDAVHVAVGGTSGTMDTSASPRDPIFWLHHANVDRIWDAWQHGPLNDDPPNGSEVLLPPPILHDTVSRALSCEALGYRYA